MDARCEALLDELKQSWSSASSSLWSAENPAAGQCGVTALIVNDRLGGDILKTEVRGNWHFYNQIDGRRVGFTVQQFDGPIRYDDVPATREDAFSDTNEDQYRALSQRLSVAGAKGR